MRSILALTAVLFATSQLGFAIYGPGLVRAAPEISLRACQEAHFENGSAIIRAMKDRRATVVADVISSALTQLLNTPADSQLYPARAFCVHELVPPYLPSTEQRSLAETPTAEVLRFRSLNLPYFFYPPDGAWILPKNPVDLEQLATSYLNSIWGREAFLMMTQLGWSKGACEEGPDQFREVILRGKPFVERYPDSEVTDDVELALANAYATWWNLSRDPSRATGAAGNPYVRGAEEAKGQAIEFYSRYLLSPKVTDQDSAVRQRLAAIVSNSGGSDTYDYFCEDYED